MKYSRNIHRLYLQFIWNLAGSCFVHSRFVDIPFRILLVCRCLFLRFPFRRFRFRRFLFHLFPVRRFRFVNSRFVDFPFCRFPFRRFQFRRFQVSLVVKLNSILKECLSARQHLKRFKNISKNGLRPLNVWVLIYITRLWRSVMLHI